MTLRWHFFYLLLICVLLLGLLGLGREYQGLKRQLSRDVAPTKAYETIRKHPRNWQVADLRSPGEYEDGHLPGALPFTDEWRGKWDLYKETVLVTEEDTPEAYREALGLFKSALYLAGGMTAWRMARLPEESGRFDPARARGRRVG